MVINFDWLKFKNTSNSPISLTSFIIFDDTALQVIILVANSLNNKDELIIKPGTSNIIPKNLTLDFNGENVFRVGNFVFFDQLWPVGIFFDLYW